MRCPRDLETDGENPWSEIQTTLWMGGKSKIKNMLENLTFNVKISI